MVQRANEPQVDHWTLPGGKVEVGETVQDALHREVNEECGIQIEIGRLIDVVDYIEKDENSTKFHFTIIDYEATYKAGKIRASSDVKDIGWFEREQIPFLKLPPITRSFFKKHYKLPF